MSNVHERFERGSRFFVFMSFFALLTFILSFETFSESLSESPAILALEPEYAQEDLENKFKFAEIDLSFQGKSPFLFGGTVVDATHPQWGRFSESLQAFESASDCVIRVNEDEDIFDLTRVDWRLLKSHPDIEVCLFRIFDTLDDPKIVRQWLSLLKYDLVEGSTLSGKSHLPLLRIPKNSFQAFLSAEKFQARVKFEEPPFLMKIFAKFVNLVLVPQPPRDHSLHLSLSKEGEISSIHSGYRGR